MKKFMLFAFFSVMLSISNAQAMTFYNDTENDIEIYISGTETIKIDAGEEATFNPLIQGGRISYKSGSGACACKLPEATDGKEFIKYNIVKLSEEDGIEIIGEEQLDAKLQKQENSYFNKKNAAIVGGAISAILIYCFARNGSQKLYPDTKK